MKEILINNFPKRTKIKSILYAKDGTNGVTTQDDNLNKTATYGLYITRPVRPEGIAGKVANKLGIGHAVFGIMDPETHVVRFSQYGNTSDSSKSNPIKGTLKFNAADINNPTDEEITTFIRQYKDLIGDVENGYTIKYIPNLDYNGVINDMNLNESGKGEFVQRCYNTGNHNCGHYAAYLANNNTINPEDSAKPARSSLFGRTFRNTMGMLMDNKEDNKRMLKENAKSLFKTLITPIPIELIQSFGNNPESYQEATNGGNTIMIPRKQALPANTREYKIQL